MGVLEDRGRFYANCSDNRWWIGPSCRRNMSLCIPVLMRGRGWFTDAIMRWSVAYWMPIAIGIMDTNKWTATLAARHRLLAFCWLPNQELWDPQPIIFPKYNQDEWLQGNKKTLPGVNEMHSLGSSHLRAQAFKASILRTRFSTG